MSATQIPLRVGVFGRTPLADAFLAALSDHIPGAQALSIDNDDDTAIADALAAETLDALVVATPSPGRAAIVAAAIEQELHVCCPLPVAADLSTLDGLIVRAARGGKVAFAPNLLRYELPVTQVYEARRSVGKPAALFATHRVRHGAGGELFADLALPLIDLAMWIVGGEVERVQVMAERLFVPERGEGGADTALMLLRFASGLTATIEATHALLDAAALDDELLVEYLGLDAVLRAMPSKLAVTVTGPHGTRMESILDPAAQSAAETFVEAVRVGQGAPQSLVDARWSLAVLEKVRLAAVTGEMVRVGGAVRR